MPSCPDRAGTRTDAGLILAAGASRRLGPAQAAAALRRRGPARRRARDRPRAAASTRPCWPWAGRRGGAARRSTPAAATWCDNPDLRRRAAPPRSPPAIAALHPDTEPWCCCSATSPASATGTSVRHPAHGGRGPTAPHRGLPLRRRRRAIRWRSPARCSRTWPPCTATRPSGSCWSSGRPTSSRSRPGRRPAGRRHRGGLPAAPGRTAEAHDGRRTARGPARRRTSRRRVPDVGIADGRAGRDDYLADVGLATALFLAVRLPQPILLEGEAGVGKTEAAKALARAPGHAAVPAAVLRGNRRRRGPLRVEPPAPAARHPAGRSPRTPSVTETDLFGPEYLLRRPLLQAHRASRPAAGRAAAGRDRPRRRRIRGLHLRAAGRGRRHHPGAGHHPGHASPDRDPDLQPDAGPA